MENTKIERKDVEKTSQAVTTSSKVAKLAVRGKVQKDNSIAGTLTARLDRYAKREKALTDIIEKRTKTITKMQGNLENFKSALAKTEKEHAIELDKIKELTKVFSGKA
jgi:hypothetical protein